ncbi:hypothetical protein TTHERM_00161710 (macronuclear) [Tetrahymena thermophila SB210]|uniref:Uncharacterized protein n=1 Tax=Tetrahymena thermophila (strain SB210) TaxID=312017 RepID=Q22VW3_TETTS|nr:hypothetical protein TTHERM_00161710 [Tetrahymena thermophila SB210]EAR89653.1 hypothetical protein TTHERM_00161710 [Tetrahymena thermophila SB210]|eukprot:XP_001009899.1 hypothetical protein TTHERM_00161710 [Tetrahymena thermophila SB210]
MQESNFNNYREQRNQHYQYQLRLIANLQGIRKFTVYKKTLNGNQEKQMCDFLKKSIQN